MSNQETVVMASGGLDSTTLVWSLRREGIGVVPLFVNYGQHCAETELETLRAVVPPDVLPRISTVNVESIYANSDSLLIKSADLWRDGVRADDMYLPYRNLLLLTVGAAYAQSAGIGRVCAAFINSNHAIELDCSSKFFDELAGLLDTYGGVSVEMPFRDMRKAEVARLALELGVPLGLTYSCQVSPSTPCGACPNCVERLDAIAEVVN